MDQISKDMVCYYCMGCGRLEDPTFFGVRRCERYVKARQTSEDIIKEIKLKLGVK